MACYSWWHQIFETDKRNVKRRTECFTEEVLHVSEEERSHTVSLQKLINEAQLGGVFMSPVWISNVSTSQFRKVHMSLSEFRPKPLISISINSFAVTVLTYINTRVTCKMSIRRVWRNNGNSARRLWLLKCVKVFWTWGRPGGGTPLYQLHRYVRSQRVWFFGCVGHK